MKKLIGLILILAIIWAVPPVRNRLGVAAAPVLEKLGPVGERLLSPTRRYATQSRATFISRLIVSDRMEGREVPTERNFQQWLRRRARGETGLDPWGRPYWLKHNPTSFTIGSDGPDGQRGTRDDVTVTVQN